MIPFGEFAPDRMIYAAGTSPNVINCMPIKDGWGPIADLSVISEALASTCLGAVWIRTSTGAYRVIAGTATKIYEYDPATFSWTDISRLAGGNYAVPSGDKWWFKPFGAYLYAGNLTDDQQRLDIDAGTNFEATPGSPPRARYAWVAGAQLVLGYIADFPNRVMTSGIGDATWWTPGRRGCDFQDFLDGEEVVGGVGSQGGAVIFQKSMIRSMTMQSGDVAFRTDVLNPSRGVAAPLSIGKIGPGQFVYLSDDGFFMGVEGRAIGIERVDDWFFQQVDRSRLNEVRALVDPFNKIVWWQSPNSAGSNFLLGYRWPLDRWCYSNAPFTEMASLVTPGITIDGLDAYFDTIDDIDIPIDSPLFTGGTPTLSVFDAQNRLCYLSGPPMAATLDAPDTQLTPDGRTWLNSARVITDARTFTVKAITSDYHGGDRTEGTAVSPYGPTGICHFRSSALLHGFRVEIPAGEAWTHTTGIDFPNGGFRPEGQR